MGSSPANGPIANLCSAARRGQATDQRQAQAPAMMLRRLLLIFALLGLIALPARAQEEPQHHHALSLIGKPKYPTDFQHFDYVNPDAPIGGRINYQVPNWVLNQSTQTFNTLNTYVLSGDAPPRIESGHAV